MLAVLGCDAGRLTAEPPASGGAFVARADAGTAEPAHPAEDAGTTSSDAPAFAPYVRPERLRVSVGAEASVVAGVTRFRATGPLRLSAEGLPAGLSLDVALLEPGAGERSLPLRRDASARPGGPFHTRLRFEPLGSPDAARYASLEIVLPDQPGELDLSLGDDGAVLWPISAESDRVEAVIASSERTLVALTGRSEVGALRGYVVALLGDGTLDQSFGEGGFVAEPPGPAESSYGALLGRADGGFLLGLYTRATADAETRFALKRFRSDGALDASFGDAGTVALGEGKAATLVARPGGFIVIGRAIEARLADGTLDARFGSGGRIDAPPITPMSSAVDAAGRLSFAECRKGRIALARLDAAGALDSSFGNGGVATLETDPGASYSGCSLALAPDGAALLAVSRFEARYFEPRGRLLRFTEDGAYDASFDASLDADGTSHHAVAGLVLQPDGAWLVYGTRYFAELKWKTYIARFRADGRRDRAFGFDEENDEVPLLGPRLVLDAYGRAVLVGSWTDATSDMKRESLSVARYWL
jgi:uncharacterized delta-60 repeat protein